MALIQLNGIISGIKGSIGGITFSNTRGGIAVKRRLSGKKSLTSRQLTSLNVNKTSANTWRSLTFGDKSNWNNFSLAYNFVNRYGQTTTLTGFNWFASINTIRTLLGLSVDPVVPTYDVPSAIPQFFVNMSATSIVLQWSIPVDPASIDILVYASSFTRRQPLLNRGGYRLLNIGTVDYTSSFDVTEAWENATGLVYGDVINVGSPNINFFIVPVSKVSYITGIGQSSTSQLPASGIGFMEIGITFIVS